jgi:hypothetical protein
MNMFLITAELQRAHDRGALKRFGTVFRDSSDGQLRLHTSMSAADIRASLSKGQKVTYDAKGRAGLEYVQDSAPRSAKDTHDGGPELTDREIRLFVSCLKDGLDPQKRRAGETELEYQWRTHGGC